jgi:hypothetical protein
MRPPFTAQNFGSSFPASLSALCDREYIQGFYKFEKRLLWQ